MYIVPTTTLYRTKREFYFAMGLLVLLTVIWFERPDLRDTRLALCFPIIGLFALLSYGLSRSGLLVDNEGVSLLLLFRRKRTLLWEHIYSVKTEWEFHGHGATPNLVIESTSTNLSFYPSHYSRKDLTFLLQTIQLKQPITVFSKKAQAMAEGRFPWYIR